MVLERAPTGCPCWTPAVQGYTPYIIDGSELNVRKGLLNRPVPAGVIHAVHRCGHVPNCTFWLLCGRTVILLSWSSL